MTGTAFAGSASLLCTFNNIFQMSFMLRKSLFLLPPALPSSVTRLGDLLDFGQVFKAFGNN